jgi:N6-adenosine-specific RNA methylase IME4
MKQDGQSEALALLPKFQAAYVALAKARTVDEVKRVHDQASAIRLYVTQQKLGLEMQNTAAEIVLRAERRAGEMLAVMQKAPGGQPYQESTGSSPQPVETAPLTLSQLGIEKTQSSRWQAIARIPEEHFESYISDTKARAQELTTAGLLRQSSAASAAANKLDLSTIPDGQYCTIVIDPPWPMQKILREERPNQVGMDYEVLSLEEIQRLPVEQLACPDGCHIYLWTTHKFLPDAFRLFEGWGVDYECLLTWVKNVGITPFSFMYSTEHALFGRIGSLPVQQKGQRLDFMADVRRHSEKPEEFYELVRKASPAPRIDLFSREAKEGFTAWGIEAGGVGTG